MLFFYNLGIGLYHLAIRLMAGRSAKARLWVDGRKNVFAELKQHIDPSRPLAWFHCASLGEFEQGRPLIEAYRQRHPEHFVLLTFYSPSGYEVQKMYSGADFVCYLPADGCSNAKRFLELVNPARAFFVKYEFWYHYLNQLKQRSVPTYLVSGIFRPDQPFFKPIVGGWFRKMLRWYDGIFVQDSASRELLEHHNIDSIIAGDTRFDRVAAVASSAKQFGLVEAFGQNAQVLVAGSTWPADEGLLADAFKLLPANWKLLIAPHEVDEPHIEAILKQFGSETVRYCKASEEDASKARVLVVDTIGLLSSLYRYGDAAYVGGGFGSGIHNTLEAAVYGVAVFFGSNYSKFREAIDLVKLGAATALDDTKTGSKALATALLDSELLREAGKQSAQYVQSKTGATPTILQELESK